MRCWSEYRKTSWPECLLNGWRWRKPGRCDWLPRWTLPLQKNQFRRRRQREQTRIAGKFRPLPVGLLLRLHRQCQLHPYWPQRFAPLWCRRRTEFGFALIGKTFRRRWAPAAPPVCWTCCLRTSWKRTNWRRMRQTQARCSTVSRATSNSVFPLCIHSTPASRGQGCRVHRLWSCAGSPWGDNRCYKKSYKKVINVNKASNTTCNVAACPDVALATPRFAFRCGYSFLIGLWQCELVRESISWRRHQLAKT